MRTWPDAFVQCIVTSPPYWGLRDYGTATWDGGDAECDHVKNKARNDAESRALIDGSVRTGASTIQFANQCGKCGAVRIDAQLGLEKSPEEYVAKMVEVFRECRRVLKADGVMFLNLGDSYIANSTGNPLSRSTLQGGKATQIEASRRPDKSCDTLKPKDLCGIPWRVAFALQADGWYLRSDIIWHKPNPMPESVTDRPTKSHEYVFLMSKSGRYYYDADAIAEDAIAEDAVYADGCNGSSFFDERDLAVRPTTSRKPRTSVERGGFNGKTNQLEGREAFRAIRQTRNRRTVWVVPTSPFPEAHFATFPVDLIKPMVMAGSKHGDTVLDPFMGAGTVALVAKELSRQYIGIELNAEYIAMAERRLTQEVLGL
jgi:DNA modification methylase